MAAYMVATLLVAFTFVQNSVAFQWRSTFDLASGHLIRACGVQDVSLPWEYYASNGEQIIDVEWNFDRTGPFPKHEVLASYVRGTFLTNSDLPHHVTFKPNAGIQLSNMTPEQSGRYSVVVHIEKYGIVNTYTRSVDIQVYATCCEADAAMLRENVQELEAERAALNRSNTYLSARASLLQRLLDKRPSSCEDLQYVNSTSGLTMIYPDNETETGISVYCDQDTDGGGWAVIQRRKDGSVDFNRNWTDYEDGFGDLAGEFWLGLANIHNLTSSGEYSLRVDLTDFDGSTAYALYDYFRVDGPEEDYRLYVRGYQTSPAGDGMITRYYDQAANYQRFSTPDRDNDNNGNGACAKNSGWWFNHCSYADLNAPYGQSGDYQGYMKWVPWHNSYSTFKGAEMKVKLRG